MFNNTLFMILLQDRIISVNLFLIKNYNQNQQRGRFPWWFYRAQSRINTGFFDF